MRCNAVRILGLVMLIPLSLSCRAIPENRPDVLLVLVDTFRADHAGCYGYPRPTTPTLDSLARSGILYERMQSQSSWTLPAMTTILTGLSPREHLAGRRSAGLYGIGTSLPYLPAIMQRNGYRTAAFFNVLFMSAEFGFHRGFDHFDCQGFTGSKSLRDAGQTVDDCLAWLNGTDGKEPYFIAIHFYDPHVTYDPPSPFDAMFTDSAYVGSYDSSWGAVPQLMSINREGDTIPSEGLENLIGLYDGELAYTDRQIGRLLDELESRGLTDSLLVIVTADHGEEFLDHNGVEHGHTLYQELLHVPMVISGCGVVPSAPVSTPVTQMDVMPTILCKAGLEPPPAMEGKSLLAPEEMDPLRAIPSSGVPWAAEEMAAAIRGTQKIVWFPDSDSSLVYELADDPGERNPLPPDSQLLELVTG